MIRVKSLNSINSQSRAEEISVPTVRIDNAFLIIRMCSSYLLQSAATMSAGIVLLS